MHHGLVLLDDQDFDNGFQESLFTGLVLSPNVSCPPLIQQLRKREKADNGTERVPDNIFITLS
jgi:hypothetical protein